MLFFYNKKMLGETLLITINDSENVTYEYKKNITLIKDENDHLVGLNIFNVENLKLQGEGSIELTEEQLTHLGYELADIRRTVEMATNMTETLAWVQLKDDTAFKEMSKKFFDTFNEQFGLLHSTLDEIAFILMNSTDKAEILGSKIFN